MFVLIFSSISVFTGTKIVRKTVFVSEVPIAWCNISKKTNMIYKRKKMHVRFNFFIPSVFLLAQKLSAKLFRQSAYTRYSLLKQAGTALKP